MAVQGHGLQSGSEGALPRPFGSPGRNDWAATFSSTSGLEKWPACSPWSRDHLEAFCWDNDGIRNTIRPLSDPVPTPGREKPPKSHGKALKKSPVQVVVGVFGSGGGRVRVVSKRKAWNLPLPSPSRGPPTPSGAPATGKPGSPGFGRTLRSGILLRLLFFLVIACWEGSERPRSRHHTRDVGGAQFGARIQKCSIFP